MSFLESDSGVLICGDSLRGIGIEVLGCAFYQYLPEYEASVKRLQTMGIKSVLLSHPTPRGLGAMTPGETVFAETLGFISRYDELLKRQSPKPLAERAAELIRTLGGQVPEHLVLAMYSVREHLRHIEIET